MDHRSASLIVLISGYLGSGKDTVGDMLKRYGFQRYAFADALKDEVSETYALNRASMDTQEGKSATAYGTTTVRDVLISHGSMRRTENVNYWVEKVSNSITAAKKARVVITDWRFPNEFERLRDAGTIITIRVQRWDRPPLLDASETALDSFDFNHIISNAGNLDMLRDRVDRFLYRLPHIGWLIVDVDDVLLDWMTGFKDHLVGKNLLTREEASIDTWNLREWISELHQSPDDIKAIILDFNRSKAFSELQPIAGSKNMLVHARSLGRDIVALSSCSDSEVIKQRRETNLSRHFHGLLSNVICLPLNSSKKSVLDQFSPKTLFLDDKEAHVLEGMQSGLSSFLFDRPWTGAAISRDVVRVKGHPAFTAFLSAQSGVNHSNVL